jgi:phosphatidate cytidylyltransferase
VPDERDETSRGPEDPFEDLDAFFAPIGDIDPDEPASPKTPPTPPPSEAQEAEDEERVPSAEDEEEILPSGWDAALEEVAPGAGVGDEATWQTPADDLGGEPAEPATTTTPPSTEPDAHTAELAGDEWDRFREAMGSVEIDDEEDDGPSFGPSSSLEEQEAGPPAYLERPEEDAPTPAEPSESREPEEEEPSVAAESEETLVSEALPLPSWAADVEGEDDLGTPEEVEEDLLADLEPAPAEPPSPVELGEDEPFSPGPDDTSVLLGELESPVETDEEPRGVRVGAAGALPGGPSWQEPTGGDVSPEPEPPRGERNIPAAFLSAIILAALGLGSLAIGAGSFAVVAGVVILLAQGELYGAMVGARYQPATAIGLLFGGFVLAAAYLEGEAAMLAMFALSVVFSFAWFMATPARRRRHVLTNVAATVLGVAYVPLLAGFVLVLVSIDRLLMLSVIGLAFLYDIAAFTGGNLWGTRPLARTISPKKSWEGAIIATLVTVVAGLALLPQVDVIGSVGRGLGLALTIALFAPLGDLAESLLKRDLGLKDMGTLLPGHGGALDRIDSVLFAAPAAFYFIRVFF